MCRILLLLLHHPGYGDVALGPDNCNKYKIYFYLIVSLVPFNYYYSLIINWTPQLALDSDLRSFACELMHTLFELSAQ